MFTRVSKVTLLLSPRECMLSRKVEKTCNSCKFIWLRHETREGGELRVREGGREGGEGKGREGNGEGKDTEENKEEEGKGE